MSTITHSHWHALNLIFEVNPWKLLEISQKIGGPAGFFRLNENQLLEAGLDPSRVKRIISNRNSIDPAKEWEKLQQTGMQVICIDDPLYPAQLKETASAPPIIYVRGNPKLLGGQNIAVVGSRKMTSYGKQAINVFIPPLVQSGVSIVSGMAFGVDTAALESCIENGGSPIAVLASSLAYQEISPHSQKYLAEKIEQQGCLVSENPPGRLIQKLHFPLRNRLVSGLSLGVIVVEGAIGSGSLITANLALDQNREVFAIPGSIFSQNSYGSLDLIKRGAKCITEFSDIAKEFNWDVKVSKKTRMLKISDPLQKMICKILSNTSATIDIIISKTQDTPANILAALTELELNGIVKQSSNGIYAKIK
ncbi:MAG TPA: DNA-processing protein DprA [Candidatus Binatia bacterium]|nr:DNA-processing protein DprA [Candidatus Binatia bacterium]